MRGVRRSNSNNMQLTIMKRVLSLIVSITFFALTLPAQTRALVTLSHEGQLKFFDNISAFEDAVTAAKDGDIIYLSEGKFGASKSSFEIDKNISIVGCGYKSHIIPSIRFYNSSGLAIAFTMPIFDGVRLEKLTFNASYDFRQIEIKKCKIDKFNSEHATDIRLDRCNIGTFNGYSNKNVQLTNCKISKFIGTECEFMENCNIKEFANYSPAFISNSIIEGFSSNHSKGIYENCMIVDKTNAISTNDYRNCYSPAEGTTSVLDDDLECTIEDMSPYVGTDGTVIGVYGGQWFPYSETPSVPTVDSANSSVEYDKETNKLNVTITVAPN